MIQPAYFLQRSSPSRDHFLSGLAGWLAIQHIGQQPGIGRPIDEMPDEFREWSIDFWDSGFVARYRLDSDVVTILAMRHQKEVGY